MENCFKNQGDCMQSSVASVRLIHENDFFCVATYGIDCNLSEGFDSSAEPLVFDLCAAVYNLPDRPYSLNIKYLLGST